VREGALTIKRTRWFGLWVSARRFSIRRKTFSGSCSYCPHRQCERGSFDSQVNLGLVIREEHEAGSASVGQECWSGVPASDHGNVRWSTRFGEGFTRSEKDRAEFASSTLKRRRSSGAPGRDRPKLTTANSFVDPPPS